MGINIGIGDGSSLFPVQTEPSFMLDDDGYYWFLQPLFEELATSTGQCIDLYGDASFANANLGALEQTLTNAEQLVNRQSETWEVCIGQKLVPHNRKTRSRPHLEKILAKVEKRRFLLMLSQWTKVVARAKVLGQPIVCCGD